MTNEELQKQEPRSSTEIESDIHTTRGRMDATLDELGDRLTARSLLNSALDWWESRGSGGRTGGATKDAYQSIARYVRENPIPSVLLGTGLVWMIIDATSEEETPSRRESAHTGERQQARRTHLNMSLVIKLKPARAAAGLLELQKTNWCRRKKRLPKSPGLRKRKSPRGAAPQARRPKASAGAPMRSTSKAVRRVLG